MVRLLSRSRMVAIMPSLEGHAPASLALGVLDGPIRWLFRHRSIRKPRLASGSQGEPDPGERGAEVSIFRMSSRWEAEFQGLGTPSPQRATTRAVADILKHLASLRGGMASNVELFRRPDGGGVWRGQQAQHCLGHCPADAAGRGATGHHLPERTPETGGR